MKCHNCSTEKTPMWRRTLDSQIDSIVTLCNACGLYYKTKGVHRPTVLVSKKNSLNTSELIDKLIDTHDHNSNIVVKDLDLKSLNIIHCANCQNINTSIWRKDDRGRNICNACGLYFKKKGVHRVVKNKSQGKNGVFLEIDDNLIRFNRIKRRKRSSSSISNSNSSSNSRSSSVTSISMAKIERSDSTSSLTSASSTPSIPETPDTSNFNTHDISSIKSGGNSPEEQSPPASLKSTPALLPSVLLPYYTISEKSRQSSIGSIDQYHYDYKPSQFQNFNLNKLSYTRSDDQQNITLPPISSILNV